MTDRMMAARAYSGEAKLKIEEIAVPDISDDEVLVRVQSSGINRGLIQVWQLGLIGLLPGTLGQESAGVVAKVGRSVHDVREGDRVRVHSVLSCRNCHFCRSRDEPFCAASACMGHIAAGDDSMPLYERYHDGGHAEYLRAPSWALDKLPDAMSFEVGARIHSLGVAYRAIGKSMPPRGGTLIINGATGAIGAAAVLCASTFGIAKVIAVSRSRKGLNSIAALAPGIVEVVATEELPQGWAEGGNLREQIVAKTGGKGADSLVDFMPVGTDATMQAIFALRRGGTAALTAGNFAQLPVTYGLFMRNGYCLRGCGGGPSRSDSDELLSLVETGQIDPSPLFTHRLPLAKANDAIDIVNGREEKPLFVMLEP